METLTTRRRQRPALELSDAHRAGYYNIGQASRQTGVSAKMIRHYESVGLVRRVDRTFANYRIYDANDLHTLRFIKRARTLGFSIKQIEALLGLWHGRKSSSQVRKVALQHVEALEQRLREMQAMRDTLRNLAEHCHGDDRPECPILEDLSNACHDAHTLNKASAMPATIAAAKVGPRMRGWASGQGGKSRE